MKLKIAVLVYGTTADAENLKPLKEELQLQIDKLKGQAECLFMFNEETIEDKKEFLKSQTKAHYYVWLTVDEVINRYFIVRRLNAIKQGFSLNQLLELGVFQKITPVM